MLKSEQEIKGGATVRSRLSQLVLNRQFAEGRTIQQQEIAEATGLNPSTISNWMKPTPIKKIDVETVVALCRYFRCEIGDLLYIDYGSQN